jgi:hypothetical protein
MGQDGGLAAGESGGRGVGLGRAGARPALPLGRDAGSARSQRRLRNPWRRRPCNQPPDCELRRTVNFPPRTHPLCVLLQQVDLLAVLKRREQPDDVGVVQLGVDEDLTGDLGVGGFAGVCGVDGEPAAVLAGASWWRARAALWNR